MYIKNKIDDQLTSFYTKYFPYMRTYKSNHRYEAIIGIGGNVGDVRRRFEHLFLFLKRDRRLDILRTSLILKNPPFGYEKQEDFFNSIMILKTSMQPIEFLDYLLKVEKRFGRKRSFANAPRTLDLDLLFFDNRYIEKKRLIVPHPHWYKRESVLIPLFEVI